MYGSKFKRRPLPQQKIRKKRERKMKMNEMKRCREGNVTG